MMFHQINHGYVPIIRGLIVFFGLFFFEATSAQGQISVAGNCNFIAVNAEIVLGRDFDFPSTCADPAWITEEYTRLFGASGVPALMALQEVNGNYRQQNQMYLVQSYRFGDYFGDLGLPLGEDTIRFWQSEWPHKDAKALINLPLWEDYSGNIMFSVVPSTFLHSHNRYELACYLAQEPMIGLGMGFGMPVFDTEFYRRNSDAISQLGGSSQCYRSEISRYEVGFTFLTLKNASNRNINELELHFRYLDDVGLEERLASHLGATSAEGLFELLESSSEFIDGMLDMVAEDANNVELLHSVFRPSDYVEFTASNKPSSVMKLADLEPGEKTIALLNVYLTNRENEFLPIYYVDGILVPEKIVYRSGAQTISRQIRDPFRTQALRKGLSWGWASQ